MKTTPKKVEAELRDYAMRYPGATEDFPWGERAIKIKGKVFLFMRATEAGVHLSVKLPQSRDMAIDFPWASPTHYGLGKHGWVTAELDLKKNPPLDLIRNWIDEISAPSRRKSSSRSSTPPVPFPRVRGEGPRSGGEGF